MPQISAFARAIDPNGKTWTDLANVHDGNTSTHGKISTNFQCEDHFTMYGFDFSDLPVTAKIDNIKVTARSSTGVMIKLMYTRTSFYQNGTEYSGLSNKDGEYTIQGVFHNSVENNSFDYSLGLSDDPRSKGAWLTQICRHTDGLTYRGREGSIPSGYTGVALELGSKATGLNNSNITIYSVMITLTYSYFDVQPVMVGNKLAKVYVGNKKVNGIYRGTTLLE